MRLVSIDIDDKKNFDAFLMRIEMSFPQKERTDKDTYAKFATFGGQPYFVLDGEMTVGVCYAFEKADMAYIFYLAIDEKLRNNGLGSKAIKAIKKHFLDKPLALSIEDIEGKDANTLRRYKFYTNNGFKSRNLSYMWQGVKLMMLSDESVDISEYIDTFGKLFNYSNYTLSR